MAPMSKDILATLVAAHQAEIYRYLRYLGADHASAEDLAQETFLAAFKAVRRPGAGDLAKSAAWLRAIARNQFFKHCRRERRNPVRADSELLKRREATWSGVFLRGGDGFDFVEALRACLQGLHGRQRKVLDLFYARGRSRADIAAGQGMSEDGVKSLLRRVRAGLGACIKRRLDLEDGS